MIQVQFTTEQFETLLELVYLGEMMVNGHRVHNFDKYTKLQDKLFALAPTIGLGICSDAESPEFPSQAFECGPVQMLMEEYDEETFWQELVKRLTELKLVKDHTAEEIIAMTHEEQLELFAINEDKITAFLEEKGLESFVP